MLLPRPPKRAPPPYRVLGIADRCCSEPGTASKSGGTRVLAAWGQSSGQTRQRLSRDGLEPKWHMTMS